MRDKIYQELIDDIIYHMIMELNKPRDFWNQHTSDYTKGYKKCLQDLKDLIEIKIKIIEKHEKGE